jgi:hypothetical protein
VQSDVGASFSACAAAGHRADISDSPICGDALDYGDDDTHRYDGSPQSVSSPQHASTHRARVEQEFRKRVSHTERHVRASATVH